MNVCKNCFSVNTDGEALIFAGVLIDGQRYDVRIVCKDAQDQTIVIPENAQYLKTMVEQVVSLSAQIFEQIGSESRSQVHLNCKQGQHPIYKEGDQTVVLDKDNTKHVREPLDKMLKLFQEETQYATVDKSQLLKVQWQKPSSWLPPPPVDMPSSKWAPPPPPPKPPAPSTWKPAPPPPVEHWTQEQLKTEVNKVLMSPINGHDWETDDKTVDDSLRRLYSDVKSTQDQDTLKWVLDYYRKVYQLHKAHAQEIHKQSKDTTSFEEWCKSQTALRMFNTSKGSFIKYLNQQITS